MKNKDQSRTWKGNQDNSGPREIWGTQPGSHGENGEGGCLLQRTPDEREVGTTPPSVEVHQSYEVEKPRIGWWNLTLHLGHLKTCGCQTPRIPQPAALRTRVLPWFLTPMRSTGGEEQQPGRSRGPKEKSPTQTRSSARRGAEGEGPEGNTRRGRGRGHHREVVEVGPGRESTLRAAYRRSSAVNMPLARRRMESLEAS